MTLNFSNLQIIFATLQVQCSPAEHFAIPDRQLVTTVSSGHFDNSKLTISEDTAIRSGFSTLGKGCWRFSSTLDSSRPEDLLFRSQIKHKTDNHSYKNIFKKKTWSKARNIGMGLAEQFRSPETNSFWFPIRTEVPLFFWSIFDLVINVDYFVYS